MFGAFILQPIHEYQTLHNFTSTSETNPLLDKPTHALVPAVPESVKLRVHERDVCKRSPMIFKSEFTRKIKIVMRSNFQPISGRSVGLKMFGIWHHMIIF